MAAPATIKYSLGRFIHHDVLGQLVYLGPAKTNYHRLFIKQVDVAGPGEEQEAYDFNTGTPPAAVRRWELIVLRTEQRPANSDDKIPANILSALELQQLRQQAALIEEVPYDQAAAAAPPPVEIQNQSQKAPKIESPPVLTKGKFIMWEAMIASWKSDYTSVPERFLASRLKRDAFTAFPEFQLGLLNQVGIDTVNEIILYAKDALDFSDSEEKMKIQLQVERFTKQDNEDWKTFVLRWQNLLDRAAACGIQFGHEIAGRKLLTASRLEREDRLRVKSRAPHLRNQEVKLAILELFAEESDDEEQPSKTASGQKTLLAADIKSIIKSEINSALYSLTNNKGGGKNNAPRDGKGNGKGGGKSNWKERCKHKGDCKFGTKCKYYHTKEEIEKFKKKEKNN